MSPEVITLILALAGGGVQAAPGDAALSGVDTLAHYRRDGRGYLMQFDEDKDGRLSPTEFDQAAASLMAAIQSSGVKGWAVVGKPRLFTMMDDNKDGYLTPAELDLEMIRRTANLPKPPTH